MLHTISNDKLQVTINSLGASLTSIIFLQTQSERLHQPDEFWASSDVVIFPIIGHAEPYSVNGKMYTPRSHGVARYNEFSLKEKTENSITLSLLSSEKTYNEYPFDFELDVTYKIKKNAIKVTYFVKSGSGEMPFYVGGHPGLVAPFGDATIVLPENSKITKFPLGQDVSEILGDGNKIQLNRQLFEKEKTLQIRGVSSPIHIYTKDEYRYKMHANCSVYAFWSNEKGGDYVAIEPWWGINDFASAPRDLWLKPFVNVVDTSGKHFSYTLKIDKLTHKKIAKKI